MKLALLKLILLHFPLDLMNDDAVLKNNEVKCSRPSVTFCGYDNEKVLKQA